MTVEQEQSFPIRVAASRAAELVGQFDLVADLSPQIAACLVEGEGVGATRALTMSSGLTVIERLVEEDALGYAYELAEGPEGIAGYRISIRVEPDGDEACTVRWRLSLTMKEGRDPQPTIDALRGLAEVGFEAARRFLEGATGA